VPPPAVTPRRRCRQRSGAVRTSTIEHLRTRSLSELAMDRTGAVLDAPRDELCLAHEHAPSAPRGSRGSTDRKMKRLCVYQRTFNSPGPYVSRSQRKSFQKGQATPLDDARVPCAAIACSPTTCLRTTDAPNTFAVTIFLFDCAEQTFEWWWQPHVAGPFLA
jgi:hypothetical protein